MSLNKELVPATADRVLHATIRRTELTLGDTVVASTAQNDNGDEALYADKSGTYTKGVLQDRLGVVDPAAYASFKQALASGDPGDFASIILGGPRTLNGPQGGLAFYQDSLDPAQFEVVPAPKVADQQYAAELIELYWASLLRDVAFTDYASDAIAARAATELSGLPGYQGPGAGGAVTPDQLFRGTLPGENVGPYLSQFLLWDRDDTAVPPKKLMLGALPLEQRYVTNAARQDFMLTTAEFEKVQNGIDTGGKLSPVAAPQYLHDGRGLAAYTHADVLYQAYFIANLVLNALGAGPNPGLPYPTRTENGFATLGGPDIAGMLGSVAVAALKAVWYQKWWVHLRHRPESGGGLVHLYKTGGKADARPDDLVLDSDAVQAVHDELNTYLLPQAFPEGSPTHPAYPTGHGAVAGACITALKFFYHPAFTFDKPVRPLADGSDVEPYVAPPGEGPLTLNGELHKLANNISFGHGIHAGIHWRSDTDTSVALGEAVALSYLRDRVQTYNEKFTVTFNRINGHPVHIGNE